jgi:hypothetical protein
MELKIGKTYIHKPTNRFGTITKMWESNCMGVEMQVKFEDGEVVTEHEPFFVIDWVDLNILQKFIWWTKGLKL